VPDGEGDEDVAGNEEGAVDPVAAPGAEEWREGGKGREGMLVYRKPQTKNPTFSPPSLPPLPQHRDGDNDTHNVQNEFHRRKVESHGLVHDPSSNDQERDDEHAGGREGGREGSVNRKIIRPSTSYAQNNQSKKERK